jgi:hypothetical protein
VAAPSTLVAPTVPSRSTRVAVYGFLALLIACGTLGVELWPFSAFRLFSTVRTGVQPRWQLVEVDAAGDERPADLGAMGRAFRQTDHLLPSLASSTPARRQAACDAWLAHDPAAVTLRVYRDVLRSPAPGQPYVVTDHVLRFTCEPPS